MLTPRAMRSFASVNIAQRRGTAPERMTTTLKQNTTPIYEKQTAQKERSQKCPVPCTHILNAFYVHASSMKLLQLRVTKLPSFRCCYGP